MDTVSYPDAELQGLIGEAAVPVRVNILEERELARRFGARWTPAVVFALPDGRVVHSFLGFLPPDEYAPQVLLARGHAAFLKGDWEAAAEQFASAADGWPQSDAAPEATYWRGVARFRLEKVTRPIYEACMEIVDRWPHHIWAKKVGFVRRYESFDLR
jgi:hypothetical protein